MTEPGTVHADSVSTPLSPGEVDRRLAVVNSLTEAQRNHLLGGLALLVTSGDFMAAVTCAEGLHSTHRDGATVTAVDLAAGSVVDAVAEFRRLTYRALVLQSMHTTLPPVWQAADDDGTDLLALALNCGCVGPDKRPCAHWDLCLAAAVWLDTPEEWAAGVDRAARVEYFAELERVAVGVDDWIAAQQPGAA